MNCVGKTEVRCLIIVTYFPEAYNEELKNMIIRAFGLTLACLALTACNSKPADDDAVTNDTSASSATAPAQKVDVPIVGEPAPEGLPSRIAREVIETNGQRCDSVTKAERSSQDGSITASCSGGENYRIYTVPGKGAVATPM